ncbi:MAG: COQ9 family protein [Pseudomonadota bacterium]
MENLDEKTALIEAALPHVPFDGWSKATLRAAAMDADIAPDIAAMLFPDLPGDMIDAYVRWSDAAMEARLPDDFDALKVREKVTTCVRVRLEIAGENEEATRVGVRAYAMPKNLRRAARSSWKTADVIWNICGDTATDYNHYTKRAILSSVYRSTLLYWLQDKSDGKADTWAFLDRRIADVMRFEKIKGKVTNRLDKLPFSKSFFRRQSNEEAAA